MHAHIKSLYLLDYFSYPHIQLDNIHDLHSKYFMIYYISSLSIPSVCMLRMFLLHFLNVFVRARIVTIELICGTSDVDDLELGSADRYFVRNTG